MADPTDISERFSRFLDNLERDGLRTALAKVLADTEYRFIAIFRFKGELATSAVYVDRENPDDLQAGEVPAMSTYCVFARNAKARFSTDDAMQDSRLTDHPAREHVRAYCGVPIMTPTGEILGTLCFYDVQPREGAKVDTTLLYMIASAIEQGNLVPPYPSGTSLAAS